MKNVAIAVLFAGVAMTAQAKETKGKAAAPHAAPANGEQTFQNLDKNADHFISQDEAVSHVELTSSWTSVDKDGDKKVSVTEYEAFEKIGKPAK